jgi:hypothetical protein
VDGDAGSLMATGTLQKRRTGWVGVVLATGVLVYRLGTFWFPVLPRRVALRVLVRRDAI